MNQDFNIQLLVSYLSGNASKEGNVLVKEWISLSDEHRLMFEEFKKVWELSASKLEPLPIDVDQAWEKFKSLADFKEDKKPQIKEFQPKKESRLRVNKFVKIFAQVAAVIIVLFGVYFVLGTQSKIEKLSVTASADQKSSPILLPDGSSITMNEGSKIVYPEEFAADVRHINFRGEAYFNVASNPEKPMIIATDNVRVKVLGTSFNLCNNDNNEISVYLESGKVLFYSVDNTDGTVLEQVILVPGQKAVFNKTTGLISKNEFSGSNFKAWKTGSLDFVNAPLNDVIRVLEKNYKIEVDSDIELDKQFLTASFNNETPQSIFETLQVIYGFDVEIKGNRVKIY